MFYAFRWIDWNIGKIELHGLSVEEVEDVVNTARHRYPKRSGPNK